MFDGAYSQERDFNVASAEHNTELHLGWHKSLAHICAYMSQMHRKGHLCLLWRMLSQRMDV